VLDISTLVGCVLVMWADPELGGDGIDLTTQGDRPPTVGVFGMSTPLSIERTRFACPRWTVSGEARTTSPHDRSGVAAGGVGGLASTIRLGLSEAWLGEILGSLDCKDCFARGSKGWNS
jgi:hypothetical protein